MRRYFYSILFLMLIVMPVYGVAESSESVQTQDGRAIRFHGLIPDQNNGFWMVEKGVVSLNTRIIFTHYYDDGVDFTQDIIKIHDYVTPDRIRQIFTDENGGWYMVMGWQLPIGGDYLYVYHFNSSGDEIDSFWTGRRTGNTSIASDLSGGIHFFTVDWFGTTYGPTGLQFFSRTPDVERLEVIIDEEALFQEIGPIYNRKDFGAFLLQYPGVDFNPMGYSAHVSRYVIDEELEHGDFVLCHFTVPGGSRMCFDDEGNGVLVFRGIGADNTTKLYFEFVTNLGQPIESMPPFVLGNSAYSQWLIGVSRIENGYLAVFYENDNPSSHTYYAQKVSDDGQLLWGEPAKILAHRPYGVGVLCRIFDGSIYCLTNYNVDGGAYMRLNKLDENGEFPWGETGIQVANSSDDHISWGKIIPNPNGGVYVHWVDEAGRHIKAVAEDGSINTTIVPVFVSTMQTDISNDQVTLTWQTQSESNLGFELSATTAQTTWNIPVENDQSTHWQAIDNPKSYTTENIITYRLYQIEPDGSSVLIDEQLVTLVDETEASPLTVWPNPANASTTFSFRVTEAQQVQVSVYDISGRLINVLASEFMPIGDKKIIWDGSSEQGNPVASGTYFVRIKKGMATQIGKVQIIK